MIRSPRELCLSHMYIASFKTGDLDVFLLHRRSAEGQGFDLPRGASLQGHGLVEPTATSLTFIHIDWPWKRALYFFSFRGTFFSFSVYVRRSIRLKFVAQRAEHSRRFARFRMYAINV